jgi:hypothetical protein
MTGDIITFTKIFRPFLWVRTGPPLPPPKKNIYILHIFEDDKNHQNI